MRLLVNFFLFFFVAILSSCECPHNLEPVSAFNVGAVVCTDGTILTTCEWAKSDKDPIALVFHKVNEGDETIGYAIYLHDVAPEAFADSLNVSQGTSCSITKFDGRENTYAIESCEDVGSPMARKVQDLWSFGQSAYIPSIAQLESLYGVLGEINKRMLAIGGDPIDTKPESCWLWSSSEVEGQNLRKAWLFSTVSGARMETLKTQKHKIRPVITVRKKRPIVN